MHQPGQAFTHEWIWKAIDALASQRELTPSALARLAGLDPTAFNRSKRITPEGRPRWPNTESIAKVLAATGTSLDEFAALHLKAVRDVPQTPNAVKLIGEVRGASVANWPADLTVRPGSGRRKAGYKGDQIRIALVVADGSLEPVYSRGNTLIIARNEKPKSGDRVVVKPVGGAALPRLLLGLSGSKISLTSLDRDGSRLEINRADIDWLGRIMWAQQ